MKLCTILVGLFAIVSSTKRRSSYVASASSAKEAATEAAHNSLSKYLSESDTYLSINNLGLAVSLVKLHDLDDETTLALLDKATTGAKAVLTHYARGGG